MISRILSSCWSWGWRVDRDEVRQLKTQMWENSIDTRDEIGLILANADPIVAWIPTFSGNVIARCRRGADGKTSSELEADRRWSRHSLWVGESVFIRETKERITKPNKIGKLDKSRSDMSGTTREPELSSVWPDKVSRSEVVLNDFPTMSDGWFELKDLPWQLQPRYRDMPLKFRRWRNAACKPPTKPKDSPGATGSQLWCTQIRHSRESYLHTCTQAAELQRDEIQNFCYKQKWKIQQNTV